MEIKQRNIGIVCHTRSVFNMQDLLKISSPCLPFSWHICNKSKEHRRMFFRVSLIIVLSNIERRSNLEICLCLVLQWYCLWGTPPSVMRVAFGLDWHVHGVVSLTKWTHDYITKLQPDQSIITSSQNKNPQIVKVNFSQDASSSKTSWTYQRILQTSAGKWLKEFL